MASCGVVPKCSFASKLNLKIDYLTGAANLSAQSLLEVHFKHEQI